MLFHGSWGGPRKYGLKEPGGFVLDRKAEGWPLERLERVRPTQRCHLKQPETTQQVPTVKEKGDCYTWASFTKRFHTCLSFPEAFPALSLPVVKGLL